MMKNAKQKRSCIIMVHAHVYLRVKTTKKNNGLKLTSKYRLNEEGLVRKVLLFASDFHKNDHKRVEKGRRKGEFKGRLKYPVWIE